MSITVLGLSADRPSLTSWSTHTDVSRLHAAPAVLSDDLVRLPTEPAVDALDGLDPSLRLRLRTPTTTSTTRPALVHLARASSRSAAARSPAPTGS